MNIFFAGDNGRIEYTITAGDDNDDFQMAENGTILTKRELDRETISTYNLVVTAKDCARQPEKRLSSTVQVNIHHTKTFFFVSLFVRKCVVSLEQSMYVAKKSLLQASWCGDLVIVQ